MTEEQKSKSEAFPASIPSSTAKKINDEFNQNTNNSKPLTPELSIANKEIMTDGSTIFMYEDIVITPNKATELLKQNNKLRIYIEKTENGPSIARLSEEPISEKNS